MDTIVLTGNTLTALEFYSIVYEHKKVSISPEAFKRLEDGRKLLYSLAESGMSIYGLNVGVGWNKDTAVPPDYYPTYNRNLILSHCIGLPPYAAPLDVRAILLSRLNTMLVGSAGPDPAIPQFYLEMLNRDILPLIPQEGSVGQADIGLMSFIGLAIIGESEVYYKGEVTPSKVAFEKEGLTPVTLGPKDGLSIVSSNGVGMGQGMLVLKEIDNIIKAADLIYCCSLEALNGNISPFNERALKLKGDTGAIETGAFLRENLAGSFLCSPDPDGKRPLQDPLCFRNVAHIHGAAREMLYFTRERLLRSINAGEDNPSLLVDEGTIIPTANFESINWVLGMEGLAVAMSHLSNAAGHRIIKLANPSFTGLPRFLTPGEGDGQVLGFATIQKAYTALNAKIRHLSTPASVDTYALAGEIEDKGTNSTYVVQRLRQIVDALRDILALELLHAAQGQDFRLEKGRKLGSKTAAAYAAVRKLVPFLDQDRVLTYDIVALGKLIRSDELTKI